MSFAVKLTIPANTTIDAPAEETLAISAMRIEQVAITFPTGCVGLVECWFEYQSMQIFPYNREKTFAGNGQTVEIEPKIDLFDSGSDLTIKGINADDTFEHTLYIVIDATFLDKEGKAGVDVIAALQSLFTMQGR